MVRITQKLRLCTWHVWSSIVAFGLSYSPLKSPTVYHIAQAKIIISAFLVSRVE